MLAKFFRISLSQGKDIIPLQKELEHAVSYLSIQNVRFQDKFTFTVDWDEKLFKQVVKTTFNQRRKTLRNSIKPILGKDCPLVAHTQNISHRTVSITLDRMRVEEHLFAAEQVGAIYQLGIVLASSSVFHHIAEITGRLQQVDAEM